jgi:hypothetical protein
MSKRTRFGNVRWANPPPPMAPLQRIDSRVFVALMRNGALFLPATGWLRRYRTTQPYRFRCSAKNIKGKTVEGRIGHDPTRAVVLCESAARTSSVESILVPDNVSVGRRWCGHDPILGSGHELHSGDGKNRLY